MGTEDEKFASTNCKNCGWLIHFYPELEKWEHSTTLAPARPTRCIRAEPVATAGLLRKLADSSDSNHPMGNLKEVVEDLENMNKYFGEQAAINMKNRRQALDSAVMLFECGDEPEAVLRVAEKYEAWLNRPMEAVEVIAATEPAEKDAVSRIVELRSYGAPYRAIAEKLTEEGFKAPKRDAEWTAMTVRDIDLREAQNPAAKEILGADPGPAIADEVQDLEEQRLEEQIYLKANVQMRQRDDSQGQWNDWTPWSPAVETFELEIEDGDGIVHQYEFQAVPFRMPMGEK